MYISIYYKFMCLKVKNSSSYVAKAYAYKTKEPASRDLHAGRWFLFLLQKIIGFLSPLHCVQVKKEKI